MAGPRMMVVPPAIDALGRFAFTTDPIQQMQDKVKMIVATKVGERIMRPRYGVDLAAYLFGFSDSAEDAMLQTDITNALGQWLPAVTVLDATSQTNDDGILTVKVNYTIPTTSSTDPTIYTAVIEVGGTVVGA